MDHFAALDWPREPWVEPDALKAHFLKLSLTAHPDRAPGDAAERARATERFARLNAAYNCLREPKTRVLHLLELELGQPPANLQNIPPETMDLFLEVGQGCREADRILGGRAKAASALLQAQWMEPALACAEKLGALQERIRLRQEKLWTELRAMNTAWQSAPPPGSPTRAAGLPLRRLEEMARDLSYLARWSGQLHERIAHISF